MEQFENISFRVFDNFFSDDFDTGDRDEYQYTEVERLNTGSNYNRWLIDLVMTLSGNMYFNMLRKDTQ